MRARLFLLSLAVAGLAGTAVAKKPKPKYTAADCDTAINKLAPVIQEIVDAAAKEAGKPTTKFDSNEMASQCKADVTKGEDPGIDCVLQAADRAAVRTCVEDATKAYQLKSKRTEASLELNKIKRSLQTSESSRFPAGTAKTLPDKPCCLQPNHQCPVTTAWAKDPVWSKLDFQLDAPSWFQYSYRSSDGLTAHITAVGDPMCSGTPITFALDAKIVDGEAKFTLTEPPN